MPAGFFVDGKLTYRPLVSVITEFAGRSGLGPANKVLAVVGEFPFLEKDVPYLFTSQTSFLSSVPVNNTMRELANIIYNPSTVAPFAGSPAGVILLNVKPNTRATGYLQHELESVLYNNVLISANVWGLAGNSTAVSITERDDGSNAILVSNGGVTESFNSPSGEGTFRVGYDYTPPVGATSAYGFIVGADSVLELVKESGEKQAQILFATVIDDSWEVANATETSWVPDAPITGTVTVQPTAGSSVNGSLTVNVVGYDSTGAAATFSHTFTEVAIEAGSPIAVVSDVVFSRVTRVAIFPPASGGATSWSGSFNFSGKVVDIGPDLGHETVSQAIQYVNSLKGFTAWTESFKAATTPFEELDPRAAVEIDVPAVSVAKLNAERWNLIKSFQSYSKLVTVEDLTPRGHVPVLPTSLVLLGGSESATSPASWLSGFSALMTSPVTVLFPYTNNHDVHVAALDHVKLMWGKGQRECQLVVAPTPNSTLTELNEKRRDLQDFRVTMLPHSIRIAQWNGTTSAYSTLYTGLMFASMQCANPEIGLPMGGGSPRALAFNGHSSIMGTDAADTLLENCMTPLEDLGDGIKIVRWVTTYSEDNDLVRTEGSSVEAIGFSNIGVRNAVKPFLNTKATPAVAPAIRSAIAAELADQVYRGVLRSWQADSLVVEETSTSFLARYTISPVLPVNHIAVTSVAIAFPIA